MAMPSKEVLQAEAERAWKLYESQVGEVAEAYFIIAQKLDDLAATYD